MAEISINNVTLAYPLLGSGVRKKILSPWMPGAGPVSRNKDRKSTGVLALKDISFTLKDGDRLGIVGPNGAGKSTLLRVLAGIYEPSIGTVRVDGEIATLFNVGLGLQAEATGYRNIILSGLISGKSRKEIMEKLPEIEEFSELGDYLNLPVRTYSNGMAMRLKFAAGTTFSPNILLMDEWLGAGDKKFTQKARERMGELVSGAGILVLASHRQRLIQNECNKILWLDSGVMKAFGEVDDILPQFLESMGVEKLQSKSDQTSNKGDTTSSGKKTKPVKMAMPAVTAPLLDEKSHTKHSKSATAKPKRGLKKKTGPKKKTGAKKKAALIKKSGGKKKNLGSKPVKTSQKKSSSNPSDKKNLDGTSSALKISVPTPKPGRKKRMGRKKKNAMAAQSKAQKTPKTKKTTPRKKKGRGQKSAAPN